MIHAGKEGAIVCKSHSFRNRAVFKGNYSSLVSTKMCYCIFLGNFKFFLITSLQLFLQKLWKCFNQLYEESIQNKQEKAVFCEQPNALPKVQQPAGKSDHLQKVKSIL